MREDSNLSIQRAGVIYWHSVDFGEDGLLAALKGEAPGVGGRTCRIAASAKGDVLSLVDRCSATDARCSTALGAVDKL